MGDSRGFMKIKRNTAEYRPACERIKDYKNVNARREEKMSRDQAARCMDCGTPFCHWACPVGNYIPEWNDLIFEGAWEKAIELLDATNNIPEVTGRVCPAPCEYGCVLGINDDPVTIKDNELDAIEYAFKHRIIKPRSPLVRTGKKVAVIGSGPAGLSAAAQLNRMGHNVTVFEKDEAIGGIMRLGIPDFKLEKDILDRRIRLWKKEGVIFKTSVEAGKDIAIDKIISENDAVCLATGSRVARDLKIEGRGLEGIYFAMDYLMQANRRVAGENIPEDKVIDAGNKKVVVIGGGDTGSDCVGTANRQGASCVVQIEVMDRPPECRTNAYTWPAYPVLLKTTSSHEEGCRRDWSVLTKRFLGEKGKLKKLECVKVEFKRKKEGGCPVMREIPGTEFEIEADMALLAVGFLHPEHKGIVSELALELDERGNIKTDKTRMTSVPGIFAAGDARRGQSLVVWAIYEGRQAAEAIDRYLTLT
jgi:glutamate synthase (NADPH/NADH) small chain